MVGLCFSMFVCSPVRVPVQGEESVADTQQVAHLDFFLYLDQSICINIQITAETQQGNLLDTQQVTHLEGYCSDR